MIKVSNISREIRNHLLVMAFLLMYSYLSFSQISPGKLTKAHAHLEGISQCTACHDLGAKVSDKKCLACHTALNAKVSKNSGYHASKDIKGKTCITCHSEHHGLNFEMIRFDKTTFNHDLTGYSLKGAHKKQDCTACHKPENIRDAKIRQNKKTYLGLQQSCTTCHSDYHQKTLSNDCAKCHSYESFTPASGFNHQNTKFQLTGGHTDVTCISCHKKTTRNGQAFQEFANTPFSNCNDCHKDPHGGSFGKDCKSCHSVESFSKMKATSAFNHSVTGFELEGKHRALDCSKCHDQRQGKEKYHEFSAVIDIQCLTCHEDTHEKKFNAQCESCHSQNSFRITSFSPDFPHDATGFSLTGKHVNTDCRKCHRGKFMTEPMAHDLCASCHKDYHEGQFESSKYKDCALCHSTEGFTISRFDEEMHAKTKFPLQGAHLATPCFSCHKKDEKWQFTGLNTQCQTCHQNIHEGFLDSKFMPDNQCTSCHEEESWHKVNFNHQTTNFPLEGKHRETRCKACHFNKDSGGNEIQEFKGLPKQCHTCHDNIHGTQFENEGVTDCARCHGFTGWDRSAFNHDNTRFALEGAHVKLSCDACHKAEWVDGKSIVQYKNGKLACSDCHQ